MMTNITRKTILFFQFCMKDIGDTHGSLAGMAKVTSSAIHKNAHISRTAEYFYMRFFVAFV